MVMKGGIRDLLSRALFFLSLAGIGFLVLNVSIHRRVEYAVMMRRADIASVRIVTTDGEVVLSKEDVGPDRLWVVHSGDRSDVADERAVETYLAVLCRIVIVEKFKLSDFGEAEGRDRLGLGSVGEITVTLHSGKEIRLSLGNESPAGTELYFVRSTVPGEVVTIPNQFRTLLLPQFMDLKSRRLIDFTRVRHISLDYNALHLELSQAGGRWTVAGDHASEQLHARLTEALGRLFYVKYLADLSRDSLVKYGFALPDMTMDVTYESGQQHYEVSRYMRRYYAATETDGTYELLFLDYAAGSALTEALHSLESGNELK